MAQREVKYGYAFARFVVSDGVTVATQSLADTSAIPKGAIMTETTVICRGAVGSGGSATLKVIAGGLSITTAFAFTKVDTAGWMYRETVPNDLTAVSTGADITLAIGTAALNAGTEELDIIVEYILLD